MDDEDLSPEEIEALSEAMDSESEIDASDLDMEVSKETAEDQQETAAAKNASSSNISHAQFTQIDPSDDDGEFEAQAIERMYDVKVKVEVLLGSCKMQLQEILNLHPGSVVELNKLAGEPVDILANGKLIARAEVVVIEENFGIKVIEISGTRQKFDAIAS